MDEKERIKIHTNRKGKYGSYTRYCSGRSYGWYPPSETVYPRNVVMYNKNLSDVLTGTCMQYSALDIFINNVANDPRYFNTPWLIDNYFRSYRKYPFIEQLLKVLIYAAYVKNRYLKAKEC